MINEGFEHGQAVGRRLQPIDPTVEEYCVLVMGCMTFKARYRLRKQFDDFDDQ